MEKKTKKKNGFGRGDWKSFFRLIPFIRMPWLLVVIGFIVNLTYSDIMSYAPVSTSLLFSGEFTGEALAQAVLYNVGNYGLMFLSLILTAVFSAEAVRRARETLWNRMLHVKSSYYDTHDPAGLISTLTNDADSAVKALFSILISVVPTVYYLVKVCMTLGSYDIRLLVSILILIPVNVIYVVILGRWRYEVNVGIYAQIGKLTSYLAERVSNILMIRSFTNEKQEETNGLEAARGLYQANVRSAKVNFVGNIADSVMELLQRALPIVFGVILLKNGSITVQQWVAFFLFTSQIISRVHDVLGVWSDIKTAQGSAARMVEIYASPVETNNGGKTSCEIADGDIIFDKVSFSYGEKQVLSDITCTIPKGKTTALVGRSGCGKTTLLSLIERMYDIQNGEIRLNGENISDYDLTDYRNHFAYVQQDAGIFGGTLRNAMTYGIEREVPETEMNEAAEKTGLLPFIRELENGYDTNLALSGRSVSGGQRQRLVLSREILKNKPVLLLDEPTSALDALSALKMQQKILEMFPGTTKLMITHDLRMLSQVDHVIFLENGCVADSGTPEEMMSRCEGYRALVLEKKEASV